MCEWAGTRVLPRELSTVSPNGQTDSSPSRGTTLSLAGTGLVAWVAQHGWLCPGWQRPPHPSRDLDVDHVAPRSRAAGVSVVCRKCNARKRSTMKGASYLRVSGSRGRLLPPPGARGAIRALRTRADRSSLGTLRTVAPTPMRTQTIRLPHHDLYAGRGKPASPYRVNAPEADQQRRIRGPRLYCQRGGMFLLWWKALSGSYLALTSASRR
jgi:hypothetical protein